MYLCAEVGGQILIFEFLCKKLKIIYCGFIVTNVGENGTFPAYSCFFTMDMFWFEEIVSGNGKYQEI